MPPEAGQDWREILVAAAALRTGVLEAFGEGSSPTQVASRTGLDARGVRIVGRALQEQAYLESRGDRLALTAKGREALHLEEGAGLGADLLLGERAIRNHLALDEVLAGGPSRDDVSSGGPEQRRRFMAAMRHISTPRAPVAAKELGSPPPGGRLLDIGGAPGTYGSAFAASGWKVTVFDLPDTLAAVAGDLAARGLSTIGGDATEALPEGPWDAIYLGNVLHLFDASTASAMVGRAAHALADGGVMAIQEMMLGRAPQAANFAVMMLVSTPTGDVYSEQTYRGWMRQSGVEPLRVVDLDEREHQLLLGRRR